MKQTSRQSISTDKGRHFIITQELTQQEFRVNSAQAGIKIAGRKINNFRYADDTTLTRESEEQLKSLLMKLKEEK